MSYPEGKRSKTVPQVRLSVVVITLGGQGNLTRCLNALISQTNLIDVEIVVSCDDRLPDVAPLKKQFPGVCFLVTAGRHTFAELRALGVRQAAGAVIALTEDHCVPNPEWCSEILQSHRDSRLAVGGAVEKMSPDTTLNWALYLADYVRYMNPIPEGPARHLTDCNVSYRRSALDDVGDIWRSEFHEPEVHEALQARGGSLWFSPRIIVQQQRSVSLIAAVRDRYIFGRLFGSGRVIKTAWMGRLIYASAAIVLPPLLVTRIAGSILRKRRCVSAFFRAFPALILLSIVWTWGEFVGTVTGRPEASSTAMLRRREAKIQS